MKPIYDAPGSAGAAIPDTAAQAVTDEIMLGRRLLMDALNDLPPNLRSALKTWAAGTYEGRKDAADFTDPAELASYRAKCIESADIRVPEDPDPWAGDAAYDAPAPPAEPPAVTITPANCAGCGKTLTEAQARLSARKYDKPLCPPCQKAAVTAQSTPVPATTEAAHGANPFPAYLSSSVDFVETKINNESRDTDDRAFRRHKAMRLIEAEADRACAKNPIFNSPHEGWALAHEEMCEAWDDVRANRKTESVAEMIQVAAMALRYVAEFGT